MVLGQLAGLHVNTNRSRRCSRSIMESASLKQTFDRGFRELMLDPTARQAMCEASIAEIKGGWANRALDPATNRAVLRFYLQVLRLGRKLAD